MLTRSEIVKEETIDKYLSYAGIKELDIETEQRLSFILQVVCLAGCEHGELIQ
jgi:hypothetical protein